MGAQCGCGDNHRQRDHVAMAEHLAGSSALFWCLLTQTVSAAAPPSVFSAGYFEFLSASECLVEFSAIIFPTEGPHCRSQSVSCLSLSLCLRGAEEVYQLGKRPVYHSQITQSEF